jgi:uncharacterized protein (DUF1697 family)
MKKTFETTIVRDGSMCFIPVPFDPRPVFGKVRAPVKVSVNGYTYRSTISAMGNGPCVPLRRSNREAAGLDGGETLKVTLELDADKREVRPPADLVKALESSPPAWDRWRALSYSHQRENVEAIEGAKKPETRARRIEGTVRTLTAGNRATGPASKVRRYAAFLRGISPMNAKMSELKGCFEAAGFTDVKTVLGSGNVVFSAPAAPEESLARVAEAAMMKKLGRTFLTIVRPVDALRAILASDPYREHGVSSRAKRVVSFVRAKPKAKLSLPIELDGARILSMKGGAIFSAYLPSPRGPVFMTLIEKTFGKEVTTRTWETLEKVSR